MGTSGSPARRGRSLSRRSAVVAVAVAIALGAAPRAARADDTGTVAAATVLFDEGVKLMDAGRHAEACTKLARSQVLAPSGGTLLVLAECYEKTGRTASAWVAYREAAARAASAGKRDAEASALERATALYSKLARLTITVQASAQSDGLEVRRDGTVVSVAELGVPVPADPGAHDVEASAPHMKPFKKTVSIRAGETLDFAIPALAPETVDSAPVTGGVAPVRTEPRAEQASSNGGTQRVLGLTIAGAGVASLVAGGIFGVLAKSKNDEALQSENCPTATRCTANGLALTDDARSRALVSTVLVAIGGAALVGGGLLYFTAPRGAGAAVSSGKAVHRPTIRILPTWSASGVGGAADVRW
ncbi:MAG: hypothetical protein QOI41_533 [Myxococcales bacterium]|nr:hypothetical protein [Myxococcales bacterium]